MNTKIDFILVRRLRKAFDLWDEYSAQQVLDITKGTTTRAFIELGIAFQQCGVETRNFAKADAALTVSRFRRFINWLKGLRK